MAQGDIGSAKPRVSPVLLAAEKAPFDWVGPFSLVFLGIPWYYQGFPVRRQSETFTDKSSINWYFQPSTGIGGVLLSSDWSTPYRLQLVRQKDAKDHDNHDDGPKDRVIGSVGHGTLPVK